MIVAPYEEEAFSAVIERLPDLVDDVDSIVVRTLAIDTPLHRALIKNFPFQFKLLQRFGDKLFPEMLALDADKRSEDKPWYVTPNLHPKGWTLPNRHLFRLPRLNRQTMTCWPLQSISYF